MSKITGYNKYIAGDIVFAKVNPSLELVISRSIDQVYYCKVKEDLNRKELVFFEIELVENSALEAKSKKVEIWENEGGAMQGV